MDETSVPAAVTQKAEEWRTTRSRVALGWLYRNFIGGYREGELSLSQVLELLGEPTQHSGSSYWYEAVDGGSLYLEARRDGKLGGWKMD